VCGGERGVDMGVSGIKTVYKLNIVILTIIINIKLIHMHGKKISCKNLYVVAKFQVSLYNINIFWHIILPGIIRFLN